MSLHKLTAGDGYTYLTRQVAAQDATHRGYDGLGDYYAQRGESPGMWLGHSAGRPVVLRSRAVGGACLHPAVRTRTAGARELPAGDRSGDGEREAAGAGEGA